MGAMVAGWVGSVIMNKLISTGFEYLEDQVTWQTGMKEELGRLQAIHPRIQAVVAYASTQLQIKDQNPALNVWLWQLRDAIDEADDVLDDLEYKKHEKQLAKNKKQIAKVRSIMRSIKKKLNKIAKRSLKIDPNLKRLEAAVKKLDKVSAGVDTFLDLVKDAKHEQQEQQKELYRTRETGSQPKTDLIGRANEKESVMQWLRKPSNEEFQTTRYRNISLLSIVGHGGMGKTALLQHVYENEITKEFDPKMWVYVSNNFDVKRVIACMLESRENSDLASLDELQRRLKSKVEFNKFLLVLDDIWGEEEKDKSKWEDVLTPLASGSLGSRILITTRMDSVASMIAKVIKKKKETIALQGLQKDECLQLLNSHAFSGVDNPDGYKKLKSISEKIVEKISGSPLAAKVIGGVLNDSFDERYWNKILENAVGRQNGILDILKLSYIFLPEHLQNCFAFCCVFPQDYLFDKDDLVRMWIALGFIQPSYNQKDILEDIGGNYFDILVKKSLFDKFQKKYKSYYKMHDLLHELAQSVSAQECSRVVGDEELSIPETIRHLSVETKNLEVLGKIENFKKLRSLFLSFFSHDDLDAFSKIFKSLRSIRLLVIYDVNWKVIPETIGCLKHLRYLKLDDHYATKLPRSISHLYHLQFIISDPNEGEYDIVGYSPKDMNNLFNLRYMRMIMHDFFGLGQLKSLQEVRFHVKNEVGYRLEELEHMNELRKLSILQLENTKDAKEACSAKLCEKKNITDLTLDWGWTLKIMVEYPKVSCRNFDIPDLDEKVFDSIQPHENLKKLSIIAFNGIRPARWINNLNYISNLEYIKLGQCLRWQTLPPFGQLRYLKFLHLKDMPEVKRLDTNKDCVFPSLEVLHIKRLEALEDWFDSTVAAEDVCLFPCLTTLQLHDCPNLQELPSVPPKLKELNIDSIGWKDLNWLQGISNCCRILIRNCCNLVFLERWQEVETIENRQLIFSELKIEDPSVLLMEPLRSVTPLKKLEITGNDELVSLPIEAERWFLLITSSLCELGFMWLKSLKSLPSFLESLSSLKTLYVMEAPQFQLLPNIPASLEQLKLTELLSLQCLPSLLTISSLKYVCLKCIPLLKSLPDLPPSLSKLELIDLDILDCLPSCFPSLSSLRQLYIEKTPRLQKLPSLPPSLSELNLIDLKILDCLPSCLSSLSSLQELFIKKIPELRELPDLPPSISKLYLINLEILDCLPSCFCSLSSLQQLYIERTPLLQKLPDLPPSLSELNLIDLEILDCLPCLSSLSSLRELDIKKIPQLRELPDLPLSLERLFIWSCHPELMKRYEKSSGSDWHKINYISHVNISNTRGNAPTCNQLNPIQSNSLNLLTT